MANLQASKKNIRKIKRQTRNNKQAISALKTTIKNARNAPNKNEISNLYSKIDSTLAKGKIHPNKAARLKSRLAILINKQSAASSKVQNAKQ